MRSCGIWRARRPRARQSIRWPKWLPRSARQRRFGRMEGQLRRRVLVEVIEHLYEEDLQKCLSAVWSLLKPDGWFIVTTPNEEDRRARISSARRNADCCFIDFSTFGPGARSHWGAYLRQMALKSMQSAQQILEHIRMRTKKTMSLPARMLRSVTKRLVNRNPHLILRCVIS